MLNRASVLGVALCLFTSPRCRVILAHGLVLALSPWLAKWFWYYIGRCWWRLWPSSGYCAVASTSCGLHWYCCYPGSIGIHVPCHSSLLLELSDAASTLAYVGLGAATYWLDFLFFSWASRQWSTLSPFDVGRRCALVWVRRSRTRRPPDVGSSTLWSRRFGGARSNSLLLLRTRTRGFV